MKQTFVLCQRALGNGDVAHCERLMVRLRDPMTLGTEAPHCSRCGLPIAFVWAPRRLSLAAPAADEGAASGHE
ncbi:MAG: hypothetical protein ACRDQZ_22790, partial [Mycobacteriales bacterium]